jgi:hypothetical protein
MLGRGENDRAAELAQRWSRGSDQPRKETSTRVRLAPAVRRVPGSQPACQPSDLRLATELCGPNTNTRGGQVSQWAPNSPAASLFLSSPKRRSPLFAISRGACVPVPALQAAEMVGPWEAANRWRTASRGPRGFRCGSDQRLRRRRAPPRHG